MRIIFTGTGRSGTGYIAALLGACGVKCGHEAIYTPAVALGHERPDWDGWEAESSWMAVPLLRTTQPEHVVLVVRHPLDVVRSYLELDVLGRDDAYVDVIRKHTPETFQGSPADRALSHWFRWNRAAMLRAAEVVRIEDLDVTHLQRWLGMLGHDRAAAEEALAVTPTDVNAKADAKAPIPPLERSMFRPSLVRQATETAEVLGYASGWLP